MNPRKPIIGITTFIEKRPNRPYIAVSEHYSRSVATAGAVPVLIPILPDSRDLSAYVDLVDGFLFSGGEDLSPLIYGEDPLPQLGKISALRDQQELELFKLAIASGKPILGICRGHQLINVGLGGTLYQDLGAQLPESLGHNQAETPVDQLYHFVDIKENSRLASLLGTTRLSVNSLHHQSVKGLAADLTATAWAADGVIEAFEATGHPFLLGIQWHPEDLTQKYSIFCRLFEALTEAARVSYVEV